MSGPIGGAAASYTSPPANVVGIGDSETNGYGLPWQKCSFFNQAIYQLGQLYSPQSAPAAVCTFQNSGVDGQTTATGVNQATNRIGTQLTPYLVTDARLSYAYRFGNVCYFELGINDIASAGLPSATIIAQHTAYLAAARAAGFRTVYHTITKFGTAGAGYEVTRNAVNNDMRANPARYDALADIDLVVESLDPTNALYFQADQVHYTTLLAKLIATQASAPAILAACL